MKVAVIFVLLAVLYCAAADEAKKEPASKESGSNNKTESSSTTASPQRMRRSPPRFDANQMKGKFAKSNKVKGLVQDYILRARRQETNIADFLSPTSGLYAAQPPAGMKSQETASSA